MWGYGPQSGMMSSWAYGGYGLFHMFVWTIILVAVVLGAVWLVRSLTTTTGPHARRSGGLDVLEERYARGEINRDEYLQKRRDIAG
jgi:putative membrane protein